MMKQSEHFQRWCESIRAKQAVISAPEPIVEGRLTRMVGLTLEAIGCEAAVGTSCNIIWLFR